MARSRQRKQPNTPAALKRFRWLNSASWGALAVVALSLLYIVFFPPSWQGGDPIDPAAMRGRTVLVVSAQQPAAPPRDYYRLPCTRLVAFRRLWSKLTNDPQPIGELYTVTDDHIWLPVRWWHQAATAMQRARNDGADVGSTPDKAFVVTNPSDWPQFTFFQQADIQDPKGIVVSQFIAAGVPMRADALNLERRVCR